MTRRAAGKTLIELVVVLAIICILLAICAPTYFKTVTWARRKADAAAGTRW